MRRLALWLYLHGAPGLVLLAAVALGYLLGRWPGFVFGTAGFMALWAWAVSRSGVEEIRRMHAQDERDRWRFFGYAWSDADATRWIDGCEIPALIVGAVLLTAIAVWGAWASR